jgi:hypothetical protein
VARPALLSTISRPEIAAMSAVIDPITLGVVFRMDTKPPPESASSGGRRFNVSHGGTSATARRPDYSSGKPTLLK